MQNKSGRKKRSQQDAGCGATDKPDPRIITQQAQRQAPSHCRCKKLQHFVHKCRPLCRAWGHTWRCTKNWLKITRETMAMLPSIRLGFADDKVKTKPEVRDCIEAVLFQADGLITSVLAGEVLLAAHGLATGTGWFVPFYECEPPSLTDWMTSPHWSVLRSWARRRGAHCAAFLTRHCSGESNVCFWAAIPLRLHSTQRVGRGSGQLDPEVRGVRVTERLRHVAEWYPAPRQRSRRQLS